MLRRTARCHFMRLILVHRPIVSAMTISTDVVTRMKSDKQSERQDDGEHGSDQHDPQNIYLAQQSNESRAREQQAQHIP